VSATVNPAAGESCFHSTSVRRMPTVLVIVFTKQRGLMTFSAPNRTSARRSWKYRKQKYGPILWTVWDETEGHAPNLSAQYGSFVGNRAGVCPIHRDYAARFVKRPEGGAS